MGGAAAAVTIENTIENTDGSDDAAEEDAGEQHRVRARAVGVGGARMSDSFVFVRRILGIFFHQYTTNIRKLNFPVASSRFKTELSGYTSFSFVLLAGL